MSKFVKIIIMILSMATTAFAENYYVKTGGDDNLSGTSDATAWATVSKVNSFTFSPGDNIYFNRGDSWSGNSLYVNVSGNSNNYITYSAYGTGNKPIITSGDENNYLVTTYDKSYINIKNIHFTNDDATSLISLYKTHHIVIDSCEIDNGATYGIGGASVDNNLVYDITIKNCNIHDNGSHGIWFNYGDTTEGEIGIAYNFIIDNNNIYGNHVSGIKMNSVNVAGGNNHMISNVSITNNNVYSNYAYGIALSSCNNFYGDNVIKSNVVYNNGADPNGTNCNGLWLGNVSNAVIEKNIVYNNNSSDIDGVGIFIDIPGQYGYPSHDCIIRNNVCYNHDSVHNQVPWDGGSGESAGNSAGIGVFGGVYNCEFYNNICYRNAVGMFIHGLDSNTPTNNNKIYNNTFVGNRIGFHIDLQPEDNL